MNGFSRKREQKKVVAKPREKKDLEPMRVTSLFRLFKTFYFFWVPTTWLVLRVSQIKRLIMTVESHC